MFPFTDICLTYLHIKRVDDMLLRASNFELNV